MFQNVELYKKNVKLCAKIQIQKVLLPANLDFLAADWVTINKYSPNKVSNKYGRYRSTLLQKRTMNKY